MVFASTAEREMSSGNRLFEVTEKIRAGAGAAGLIAMGAAGLGAGLPSVVIMAAIAALAAARLTTVSDREAKLETLAGRESVMSDASDV